MRSFDGREIWRKIMHEFVQAALKSPFNVLTTLIMWLWKSCDIFLQKWKNAYVLQGPVI